MAFNAKQKDLMQNKTEMPTILQQQSVVLLYRDIFAAYFIFLSFRNHFVESESDDQRLLSLVSSWSLVRQMTN